MFEERGRGLLGSSLKKNVSSLEQLNLWEGTTGAVVGVASGAAVGEGARVAATPAATAPAGKPSEVKGHSIRIPGHRRMRQPIRCDVASGAHTWW